jgi:tRNA-specific 2-thiouridylase
VAALLLKEQGYEVIGLFMKNWEEKTSEGVCLSSQDYEDVVKVCKQIDIPYFSVNFVKEYWDNVFTNFIEELKLGYTPNPDVLCNREIKFKVFFQKAIDLGADFLATGHYAKTDHKRLLKSIDQDKDQTYFLYTLQTKTLEKVLFPLSGLTKKKCEPLLLNMGLQPQKKG